MGPLARATDPRVSVVVSTRNRAATIPCCIESLAALRSRHPFEIVLVDNASSDETAARLLEFAKRHGDRLEIRVIHAPEPGVSHGRNAGVAASRGELVAFTDDDCHPSPGWLDDVVDAFDTRGVDFLGGRIELHDPRDAAFSIQLRENVQLLPPRSYVPAGLILGANLSMRRSALDALSGFDPRLGGGTRFPAEDTDLVARASAAGFAGGYFPQVVVAHHHRRRDPETVRVLRRGYAWGRAAHFSERLASPETRALYLPRILRHWRRRPDQILPEIRGAAAWWYRGRAGKHGGTDGATREPPHHTR